MKGYTSVEVATAKRLTNRAILIFGLLAFTGCADYARWVDERDDATCQSYGLSRGDEKFGLCRMMINQQRTQNSLRVYEQGQGVTEPEQSNADASADAAAKSRVFLLHHLWHYQLQLIGGRGDDREPRREAGRLSSRQSM